MKTGVLLLFCCLLARSRAAPPASDGDVGQADAVVANDAAQEPATVHVASDEDDGVETAAFGSGPGQKARIAVIPNRRAFPSREKLRGIAWIMRDIQRLLEDKLDRSNSLYDQLVREQQRQGSEINDIRDKISSQRTSSRTSQG